MSHRKPEFKEPESHDEQEACLPLALEEGTVSFKAVCVSNIPAKTARNKGQAALCSQNVQRHDRPTGTVSRQSIRPEWSPNRMRLYLTNNFDFCQNEDRLKFSISIFILLTIFYILTGHLLILGLLFNFIYRFYRNGHLYLLIIQ